MREEQIRDFQTRKIIGFLRYLDNGDIEAVDFASRRVLGKYIKAGDYTIELNSRRIVAKGNVAVSFIWQNVEQYR